MSPDPAATVVISTHNRRDELLVAIGSVRAQTVPVEILVIDDASDDGTSEAVRERHPDVVVHRYETHRGYIAARNHGARLARAPVWITMDDDAEMPSPRTVEQTLAEFSDPRIAAVAIPYTEPAFPKPPPQTGPGLLVTSMFIGCAGALRRDAFLAAGGFRESLVAHGEESDLCLRLLQRGQVVALGRADPMVHHVSPRRDSAGKLRQSARSELLVTYADVPLPDALTRAGINVAVHLRSAARQRRPAPVLRGFARAARDARHEERRPVSRSTYRLYRELERQAGSGRYRLTLGDIAGRLPKAVG